ncbi:hypothetical protein K443DRAFT_12516 [Laccaria amethystina LaAM-08-1]|uniref:Unplaced genomic scaffold K443scaffold_283, whole genome shotgun sequence n=1 Tax=Laccaria amethystina LaAM-08-1 TaxID=1095629 RepID=A0A0C9WJ14_9AGAR|nr:hypothetical protein K443DRAFT_12516 [Laccaria amethystina LaAM-08-1]
MVSSFLPKRTVCLRPLDGLLSRWPLSLDELDEQPPSSLDGQPLDGQPNGSLPPLTNGSLPLSMDDLPHSSTNGFSSLPRQADFPPSRWTNGVRG